MTTIPIKPPRSFFSMATRQHLAIQDVLDEVAVEAKEMLLKPTSTWNNVPHFIIHKTPKGREVFTTEKPYLYLTRGTRVRYATMTGGFMAKTKIRVLSSGPGAGGVAFISRKHPRPGIKARGWEEMVKEKMDKTMPAAINKAIRGTLK